MNRQVMSEANDNFLATSTSAVSVICSLNIDWHCTNWSLLSNWSLSWCTTPFFSRLDIKSSLVIGQYLAKYMSLPVTEVLFGGSDDLTGMRSKISYDGFDVVIGLESSTENRNYKGSYRCWKFLKNAYVLVWCLQGLNSGWILDLVLETFETNLTAFVINCFLS